MNWRCMKVIHTEEKPFACTKCDKTFKLNGELKMHGRTHTGEKPFDCSECEKAYTQNVHLKSHEMIHTGEKSFACSKCDKTFKLNGELKTHESYLHLRKAVCMLQKWQDIQTKWWIEDAWKLHTQDRSH